MCGHDNVPQSSEEIGLWRKIARLAEQRRRRSIVRRRGLAVKEVEDNVDHWQIGVPGEDKVALSQRRSV